MKSSENYNYGFHFERNLPLGSHPLRVGKYKIRLTDLWRSTLHCKNLVPEIHLPEQQRLDPGYCKQLVLHDSP